MALIKMQIEHGGVQRGVWRLLKPFIAGGMVAWFPMTIASQCSKLRK